MVPNKISTYTGDVYDPDFFLVLGEPPESLIVMDCDKDGQVLWSKSVRLNLSSFTPYATPDNAPVPCPPPF